MCAVSFIDLPYAIDATRVHQTRSWVVYFSISRPFGPSRCSAQDFVYGVFVSYAVFFNTFPINMVLQYRKVGRWSDYRYGELWYVFLSLGSKSLLAWVVFGGTQQPN